MTGLLIITTLAALAGWGTALWLYRDLYYTRIRERALDGGNRTLQQRYVDAAAQVRFLEDAVKVKDEYIDWLTQKEIQQ